MLIKILKEVNRQQLPYRMRGIYPNEIYVSRNVYKRIEAENMKVLNQHIYNLGDQEYRNKITTPTNPVLVEDLYEKRFMGMKLFIIEEPDDHIRVVYVEEFE